MRNEPTGYGGRFSRTPATKPGIRESSRAGSVPGTRLVAALSVVRSSHAMTKHIRQRAILQGHRSSSARIQTAANRATRTAMRRKTLASACWHGMQPDPPLPGKASLLVASATGSRKRRVFLGSTMPKPGGDCLSPLAGMSKGTGTAPPGDVHLRQQSHHTDSSLPTRGKRAAATLHRSAPRPRGSPPRSRAA